MPYCGDHGFKNKEGKPCGQTCFDSEAPEKGCYFHGQSKEDRLAKEREAGRSVARNKLLGEGVKLPSFQSRQHVTRTARVLMEQVLRTSIDPRRVDVALRACQVALGSFAQETQEKLIEALQRIEHGGASVILLNQLASGLATGRRRELPSGRAGITPAPRSVKEAALGELGAAMEESAG